MSFLSRLGVLEQEGEVAAITRGLGALLQAKKRHASPLDFGLGDYDAALGWPDIGLALAAEIEDAVRRHEPRLIAPRVESVGPDGPLWAAILLTGVVNAERRAFEIRLHTPSREVLVRAR